MPRSKVSAFFSVLLVFASGAAMGAVGYRLYTVKSITATVQAPTNKKKMMMSPDEMRKRVIDHLNDLVKLNPEQLSEVQKIYDWQGEQWVQRKKAVDAQMDQIQHDYHSGLNQLHDSAVAKIKAVLTPEQQPLYDKWLAERAAERKRHEEQDKKQGPGGPRQHGDNHRPPGPDPQP